MNDEGNRTEITDQTASSKPLEELDKIEKPTQEEVLAAIEEMWSTAKKVKKELAEELERVDVDELVRKFNSEYKTKVTDGFKYTYEREPTLTASIINCLENGKKMLTSGEMTPIEGVSDVVVKWQGDAKMSFNKYFLNPFGNAVTNQQAMFDELTTAIAAYETMLWAARSDAIKLANTCRDYLEQLDNTGKAPAESKKNIKAFGIAALVVSTVVGGGPGMPFGLIGLGLGIVGDGKKDDGKITMDSQASPTFSFSCIHIESAMDELIEELDNMKLAMDEEEKGIAKGLKKTISELESYLTSTTPLEKATILPTEPSDSKHGMEDDGMPNLTGEEKPSMDDFNPY